MRSVLRLRAFGVHSYANTEKLNLVICSMYQKLETILVKDGAQRLKQVLHSFNASLMSKLGSDVPIVLTSTQEKGESRMGQDLGCRPVIHSLPFQATNAFFFVPCCVGSYNISQEQDPSTQESWSGPTAISAFLLH
ncbi:hypothetical protein AVEN_137905-1 [Araneus ventricosus]|uniref:Uncharacterized protein n=1 Tax=Araneus ventricosus TaxID=182803 RepID=A0A4Y2IWS0_ARAVE|nr:hypothetical protein AVEN_137905-1 [Araneus ventricosus]